MSDLLLKRAASISPCGRYRYSLTRTWRFGHTATGTWLLPIIMLNPSTADAEIDDPTIRRCMAFGRREGWDGIKVVNLFSYRATSPAEMRAADDPIGADGLAVIERTLEAAATLKMPVLAAWGCHGTHRGRDEAVKLSAKGWGTRLVCLGTTKDGHPKHPLYVPGDQPLLPFGRAA